MATVTADRQAAPHQPAPEPGTLRDFLGIPRAEALAFDYPMTGECGCGRPVVKDGPGLPWLHEEGIGG
jgi:hypothetical protein